MCFLRFETRKSLKNRLIEKEYELNKRIKRIQQLTTEKKWLENALNLYVFGNCYETVPDNAQLLAYVPITEESIKEFGDEDGNATLYIDSDSQYIYLGKDITEGYSHISININNGRLRMFLNNENIGLKIDSNNRIKDKTIILFFKDYFSIKNSPEEKKYRFFLRKV